MIYEQLTLPICQKPIATVSDFHVKVSALLENEVASKIPEELYSLKSCGWLKSDGLQYYSQKTLLDCLHMRGGATFGTIITTMAELGYSVEWQVLDSQHFGVAQHRERVFIIGHLGNGCGRKIFPVGTDDPTVNELQRRKADNRIVTNTLTTRVLADTTGTYIADRQTDRQTDNSIEGRRIPQGIILGTYKPPKLTDISATIDTKIGTCPGFTATYVIDYDKRFERTKK